jgi:hypothetical protein
MALNLKSIFIFGPGCFGVPYFAFSHVPPAPEKQNAKPCASRRSSSGGMLWNFYHEQICKGLLW